LAGVFILNEIFARESNSASDLEIFCRRRRHNGGRFFNINGAVSPSALKFFKRPERETWPAFFWMKFLLASPNPQLP
jgi:hypothetical protein